MTNRYTISAMGDCRASRRTVTATIEYLDTAHVRRSITAEVSGKFWRSRALDLVPYGTLWQCLAIRREGGQ